MFAPHDKCRGILSQYCRGLNPSQHALRMGLKGEKRSLAAPCSVSLPAPSSSSSYCITGPRSGGRSQRWGSRSGLLSPSLCLVQFLKAPHYTLWLYACFIEVSLRVKSNHYSCHSALILLYFWMFHFCHLHLFIFYVTFKLFYSWLSLTVKYWG